MVTIGTNYEIIDGRQSDFERVFNKMLQIMEGIAGHKHTQLYRNVLKPNAYMVVSEWTDPVAFNVFIQSDQFRDIADWGREKILAAGPHHEIFGEGKPIEPVRATPSRRPVGVRG